eukprot:46155_1
MTSASISALRELNLVFGYIRARNDIYFPDNIIQIVLTFYTFFELFRDVVDQTIGISNNKRVAKRSKIELNNWGVIQGNIDIDCKLYPKGLCQWNLKMHANHIVNKTFAVGLVEQGSCLHSIGVSLKHFIFNQLGKRKYYGFQTVNNNAKRLTNQQISVERLIFNERTGQFEVKSVDEKIYGWDMHEILETETAIIFKLQFDIRDKTLTLYVDGIKHPYEHKNIDISKIYTLSLAMLNAHMKFEIIDFVMAD